MYLSINFVSYFSGGNFFGDAECFNSSSEIWTAKIILCFIVSSLSIRRSFVMRLLPLLNSKAPDQFLLLFKWSRILKNMPLCKLNLFKLIGKIRNFYHMYHITIASGSFSGRFLFYLYY